MYLSLLPAKGVCGKKSDATRQAEACMVHKVPQNQKHATAEQHALNGRGAGRSEVRCVDSGVPTENDARRVCGGGWPAGRPARPCQSPIRRVRT